MDRSEVSASEDNEDVPLRLEGMSSQSQSQPEQREGRRGEEEGALSDLSSAFASTYSSFTSLLNRSATDISEATKKIPSQFQNLADGGTTMFKGLTDLISHGLPGNNDNFQPPDFEMLKKTFGLTHSDALIGSFTCELQQQYRPINNTLSPNIQMSFPVMVSVTEAALCITVEHGGHQYPGKITKEELVSLSSDADMLVLTMTDDRQVVFRNFGRTESKVMAFKFIQYLMPK